MKALKSKFPILALLFSSLSAVSPSSASAESFTAEKRAKFYLQLMPQSLQVETEIAVSEFAAFQQSCFQTDYGPWLKTVKSADELAQRDAFLTRKLNRPFYFQYVPRNDAKPQVASLQFIGSINDLREMICAALVLNDGKFSSDGRGVTSSDFIQSVLRLPNINSQVVDFMLSRWDMSPRDVDALDAIMSHPLFNAFNMRDLFVSLFKKPMATASRIGILTTILNSAHYLKYQQDFSSLLLRESSNFIPPEERFAMARILVHRKEFDRLALLSFATTQVDSSKDYTDLYQQFSNGQTLSRQFHILTNMLHAGANITNVEKIFFGIWGNSNSSELNDMMTTFAQKDLTNSRWLSREAVHRLTTERLSMPVSAEIIETTLFYYRRGDESTPEMKLKVIQLLGLQPSSFDASSAASFVDMANELRLTKPSIEDEVSGFVSAVGTRFKKDDNVFVSYFRYLKKMRNKKSQMSLVQKLLPDTRIEEQDLIAIANDIFDRDSDASYAFLELMLDQPQLSARGLSELSNIVKPTRYVGFTPDLNAASRKILTLILGHRSATDKVRDHVDQILNPKLKYIEEPTPLAQ